MFDTTPVLDLVHQAAPAAPAAPKDVGNIGTIGRLGDPGDLGTSLYATTFVVLDLETTGGSPTADAITEVGALKSTGGQVTGTFHTLVSPGRSIPAPIQLVTGIDEQTVAGAPPIEAVLPSLWEFLRGTVLVAHNARFDAAFLAAAFARHGYALPFRRTVDTLRLARRLLAGEISETGEIGDLRLETLAGHFGASAEPRHRAFPDARATLDVFHRLLELAGPLGILTCEDLLVFGRTGRAPDLGKMKMAAGVPRAPGVYLFADAQGRVLYVGRARNLRARVRSYFYGGGRRGVADLVRRAVAVYVERCATEVEAEVRELRLLRLHEPPFNRADRVGHRSQRPPRPAWVRIVPGQVPRLAVVRSPAHATSALLGPFSSQRAAHEAVEAIRDAVPAARCADPRRHPSGCAFGHTGRCLAPCLSERRPAHDRLLAWLQEAVASGGSEVLEALDARMTSGAEPPAALFQQSVRLADALERRRAARALAAAGDVVVCVPRRAARGSTAGEPDDAVRTRSRERTAGPGEAVVMEVAVIRSGHLVRTWVQPTGEPVSAERAFEPPAPEPGPADQPHPDGLHTGAADTSHKGHDRIDADLGDAEELMIVWRFLERAARRGGWIASCSGELSCRISDRLAAERLRAGSALVRSMQAGLPG